MKINKALLATTLLGTSVLAAPALAVEGLSANVGLTSDYLWRGVTQTDGDAAISGGIDYAHSSGFYVGTWASNVDFGDDATYELDLYTGFGGEISGFAYDLGYIYYAYPNGDDLDFGEIYGSVGYGFATVGLAVTAHSDFDSDFGDDYYYFADFAFEVLDGLELGFHIGSYDFDEGDDYVDYNAYIAKNGFSFMLSDNDMDGEDMRAVVSYSIDIDL